MALDAASGATRTRYGTAPSLGPGRAHERSNGILRLPNDALRMLVDAPILIVGSR